MNENPMSLGQNTSILDTPQVIAQRLYVERLAIGDSLLKAHAYVLHKTKIDLSWEVISELYAKKGVIDDTKTNI